MSTNIARERGSMPPPDSELFSRENINHAIEQARSLKNMKVFKPDGSLNVEETRRQRERIIEERIQAFVPYFPEGLGMAEDENGLPVYGKLEHEA